MLSCFIYKNSVVFYVVGREFLYEDTFAAVNDSVTIPCYGSSAKPVVWQYKSPVALNAQNLYDEHGLISDNVGKYTIHHTAYDLTIHNVKVDDAGEYWCVEDEGFGAKHVTELFIKGNFCYCYTIVKLWTA